MGKFRELQNSRQKRKSNNTKVDSDNEEEVCSPKKHSRVEQKVVQKDKLNAINDTSSDSDSDSDEEMVVEKLKGKSFEHVEELNENDSSDYDDDVVNDDGDGRDSDVSENAESDDDDDNDGDDSDDDDDSDNNGLNKTTESGKMKFYNADKLTLSSKSLQSGDKKIGSEISSSGDEDSVDSSESESDNSDNKETVKSGTKKGAVRLKTAPVKKKQQKKAAKNTTGIGNKKQLKRTVNENSDNAESSDSSEDDDDSDDEEKNIEHKKETHSKSKVRSNSGMQEDEEGSSSSSDDESDNDNKSDDDETDNDDKQVNSKSEVSQISNKHKVDSTVTQGVKMEVKESSSDSENSDSSDDEEEEEDAAAKITDENDDVKGTATSGNGSENDASGDEFAAVKKELANIPLEDLMKVKEKLGLKMFNRIMHGDKFEEKKQKVFKRENKNRPMEMSAKKRVPVLRHATVAKEKVRRDPRFDDLSGEFQDKHFMKNYSFLNDVKSKEKLLVQKKMKKTKDEDKKKELAKLLNRMNQQEQIEQKKRHRMEMEQQWKEKEKQLVKDGKTPYFLKKSEKKKLELAEKYKELQKSGKVDQYMSKRLKKNAQKEKKKLPGRHQRFM
ncbi:uncharacterized protein LOC123532674 [Mercenaria mercenaria]|uniref:uncharacterized protein LOC123532674 n=2 Tax=Mercenaria mercenaria TaxID=6596 RepID=UPI00234F71F2|nr:uncharacterized protein LOC123532674 [Mercenaria mercenaria]XP_053408131.1 uncharacterized protein LOC123532674 [Mercenaria mercenaria]